MTTDNENKREFLAAALTASIVVPGLQETKAALELAEEITAGMSHHDVDVAKATAEAVTGRIRGGSDEENVEPLTTALALMLTAPSLEKAMSCFWMAHGMASDLSAAAVTRAIEDAPGAAEVLMEG